MTWHDPFNPMPTFPDEDEKLRHAERRGGRSYWAVGVLAAIAVALVAVMAAA